MSTTSPSRPEVGWKVPVGTARLAVHLVVEYSPKPDGSGSDLYLCGACGIGLVRRPHGASLNLSHIDCPNCWMPNEP